MERQVTDRRCLTMIAAATIWSALLTGAGAAAQPHTAGGGWGTAQPVPGLAALNTGHDVNVSHGLIAWRRASAENQEAPGK